MEKKRSYSVDLDFEAIKLPPVNDILVLGKKAPQGRQGILHSFELILPDVFELVEVDDPLFPAIDAVIINKVILVKLPLAQVLDILKESVFPYVSVGELIKVEFSVRIYNTSIVGEIAYASS